MPYLNGSRVMSGVDRGRRRFCSHYRSGWRTLVPKVNLFTWVTDWYTKKSFNYMADSVMRLKKYPLINYNSSSAKSEYY